MIRGSHAAVAALLVLGGLTACSDDKPRWDPPPAARSPARSQLPRKPPPPPVFELNRGADVLTQQQVVLQDGGPDGSASDWVGRWHGTQTMLTGDLQGTLTVDMNVTRLRDGTLRLTQSGFGITVIKDLVPSPEQPGNLAAGSSVDHHSAGSVSFSSRSELTAMRSGNHLTIGMHVTRLDSGTYNGQKLPIPPPSTSVLVLERR